MQPLTGVRVLAVEQYGAGPFGSMYLANQGAEVIKIENPSDGGDMSRAVGPYFLGPEDSEFFHSFNALMIRNASKSLTYIKSFTLNIIITMIIVREFRLNVHLTC